MRRVRADIGLVSLVQGCEGFIGCLPVIIFGLVIQKRDLKMTLVRRLLQQREIVIRKMAA